MKRLFLEGEKEAEGSKKVRENGRKNKNKLERERETKKIKNKKLFKQKEKTHGLSTVYT